MTPSARYVLDAAGVDSDEQMPWRHQLPQRVRVIEYDYVYGQGPWASDPSEAAFGPITLPTTPAQRSGRSTLVAFMNLAEPRAGPRKIAAFVRRHGPLGLCAHGLPRTHAPERDESGPRQGWLCPDVVHGGTSGLERIDDIRWWARFARATVRAIVSLAAADVPADVNAEWRELARIDLPATVDDRAKFVTRLLNECWLRWGMVQPEVDLTGTPRVRTSHFGGLIGVVAMELARTALSAEIAFCSACMRAIEVAKRPQRGRDIYCGSAACARVKWRRAKERQRGGEPKRRPRRRSTH